ncbi:rRNA methyltransferase 3A, mitochondrial [Trichomycterus rosablanca]|uniref:rRNA methyltransferase 3A, mitochondrial n=1 Tax=Trichomycterus rosablanca TaxID=2290929 RepID=UPI002F358471
MAALVSMLNRELTVITGRSSLLNGCNSVVINPRRSIRGLRRRPVAVLYPGDERETVLKPNRTSESNLQHKHEPAGLKRSSGLKPVQTPGAAINKPSGNKITPKLSIDTCSVREQLGGLRFEKALPGDKRLAKLVSVGRSRAFREQEGKVLLEGRRLICDALAAGATPQVLFFSRVERLQELPLDKLGQASLVKVKFEDLKIWSDLVTPQGLIGIFSKPEASRLMFPKDLRLQSIRLFLICDNVRDAGSLGTILRCAAASGCDRVLLTQGCVDAWEPKVLRAAMGAHFRIPIFPGLDWDRISEHLPEQVTVHVAEDAIAPLVNKTKTQSEEYDDSDSEEEPDDDFAYPCLERKVYHENWAHKNTALVVGGETHGLSLKAFQLAEDTNGYKLCIPTAPEIGCLSSAMMASILLFEGRRQLMKSVQKASRRVRSVTSK